MAAKVWGILNQKGGTSKTTTATNLASCLAVAHKKRVLLVDLDPQGSSSDWAAARGETPGDIGVIPTVAMGKALARDLPRIASGYDYVLIDGVPQISELTAAAIKASDVILIPVQPSQYDIWACGDLVQLVKDRQELADGKPAAALMIARAIPNTLIERDAREALEGFELPILKAQTCQRQSYVRGVDTGRSVMDLPADDKGRLEIEALALELMELSK
ncbi:ParA family partition ATPase [Pseudomonas sp. PE-S1G-1]|uniref:ParA family partition ATPase n=1 Tax=Pseudomonas sp. PE-S1G-1 TaxID=1986995 RepID=UPI000B3FF59D|nr:ParA family partition ATPase [Pseudomonas sp. PE-S1G-1]